MKNGGTYLNTRRIELKTAEIRRMQNISDDMRGPDILFFVDLYKNNEYFGTINTTNKSIYYAEDVATNWQQGILGEDNEYIEKFSQPPRNVERKT